MQSIKKKKGLRSFNHHAYTHRSLDGTVPTFPKQQTVGEVQSIPVVGKRLPYLVLHFPSKQILFENQERVGSNAPK